VNDHRAFGGDGSGFGVRGPRPIGVGIGIGIGAGAPYTAHIMTFPRERTWLLPALHAPQHGAGWVSPEALAAIAAHLRVRLSEVYGVATHYYPEVRLTKQGARLVRVCTGVSCRVTGGGTLLSACEERLGIRAGDTSREGTVTIEEMDCAFDCAVVRVVEVDGAQVGRVQAADLPDLLYGTRGTQHPTPPSAASPAPAPASPAPSVRADVGASPMAVYQSLQRHAARGGSQARLVWWASARAGTPWAPMPRARRSSMRCSGSGCRWPWSPADATVYAGPRPPSTSSARAARARWPASPATPSRACWMRLPRRPRFPASWSRRCSPASSACCSSAGAVACVSSPPCTTPVSCACSSPTWAGAGPRPPPDRPRPSPTTPRPPGHPRPGARPAPHGPLSVLLDRRRLPPGRPSAPLSRSRGP